MTVAIDKKAPSFKASGTEGVVTSKSLLGQPYVLYFYPKDDTPGCSREAQDFAGAYAEFQRRGVRVLGVSRDSLGAHEKFRAKFDLPFPLLADEEETLCRQFDVIRLKNMYGKQVRGIERSTFLVDGAGVLRREWRKVKVDGHVEEVLAAVAALQER